MQFTVSLAQMQIKVGQVDQNVACASDFISQASSLASSIVLLPELWSSGYDLANAHHYAQAAPELINELSRLAKHYQICLGGSILMAFKDGIFNTFTWIDPDLENPIFYQKIHLFRLMQEEQWLKPGESLQTVQTNMGLAGLAVCYDLRFPELFRRYAVGGAVCYLLSAEWPIRRINHWQILLQARAIENQSFLLAANCVGQSGKDQFGGSSAVISPWGEVLIEGDQANEAWLTTKMDTDQIDQARQFMPVFQDRRIDLY